MAQSVLTLLAVLAVWLAPEIALAQGRVALVIGNGAYPSAGRLPNTKNDASDIGRALARLGFEVLEGIDQNKRDMERLVRHFGTKLPGADIAFFFYAGHGIQVSGENYLVPVDARLESEGDVDFESLALRLVLKQMEREAKTSILILDACRNNPLATNLARKMATRNTRVDVGLSPIQSAVGTLIAYSTQPNNVALDGEGRRNSPYTEALLAHIEQPGRDLASALNMVRADVVRATGGRQVPWENTSLMGPVILGGGSDSRQQQKPDKPQATEAERAWTSIRDTKSIPTLEAYIRRFPGTFYSEAASARITELRQATEVEQRALKQKQDQERRAEEAERQRQAMTRQNAETNSANTGTTDTLPVPAHKHWMNQFGSVVEYRRQGSAVVLVMVRPGSQAASSGARSGDRVFSGVYSGAGNRVSGSAMGYAQGGCTYQVPATLVVERDVIVEEVSSGRGACGLLRTQSAKVIFTPTK